MKLFVQIPCWNEAANVEEVIRGIPRHIEGVDAVLVVVVDDGSTDGTAEVARAAGADYVLRLLHRGLASAFASGLVRCVELGADLIVNTDGDLHYEGRDIPRLIAPLLDGRAEVVIGDRHPGRLDYFSWTKRLLQRLGSRTVSVLANVSVPDATSGFRAYTRAAAMRLRVYSKFTYTLETTIQAGRAGMAVAHVPIQANPPRRPSRLFSHAGQYVRRSIPTLVRIYALYEPLRMFLYVGALVLVAGMAGVLRVLYLWWQGSDGHLQSLLVSGVLLVSGFQLWMLGIVADLLAVDRRLHEDVESRLRRRGAGDGTARSGATRP